MARRKRSCAHRGPNRGPATDGSAHPRRLRHWYLLFWLVAGVVAVGVFTVSVLIARYRPSTEQELSPAPGPSSASAGPLSPAHDSLLLPTASPGATIDQMVEQAMAASERLVDKFPESPHGEGRPGTTRQTAALAPGRPPQTESVTPPGDPPMPATVAQLIEEVRLETERLAESFPDDPDALEIKARVLFALGRNTEAAKCWQLALDLNPRYGYAYRGLGQVAVKGGDYEEAVALQRKTLSLIPSLSDAAHDLADSLLKLGKIEEAVGVLEEHLKVRPESTATFVHLGHTHLAAHDYKRAKEAFETALGQYADIPRAQFGLATALARLGKKEEAAEAVETYRQLRSRETEVRTDSRKAVDDLDARLVDFARRSVNMSRLYLAHGKPEEAERLARRAAQLDPNNTDCRVDLASLYQKMGRPGDTLRMCRELVAIAPEHPAYQLNLGVMCDNLGLVDDAEAAFREVIRLTPESSRGYTLTAQLCLRHGRSEDQALLLAQKAVELQPTAPNYSLLSQAYNANKDHGGALRAIEQAVEMDPRNQRYQETLNLLSKEGARP